MPRRAGPTRQPVASHDPRTAALGGAGGPELYLALTALAVIGISSQVFLPHLLIYIQYRCRSRRTRSSWRVVLVGASTIGVLGGRVIDRIGKVNAMLPAAAIYIVGLVLTFAARSLVPLIGAGLVLMSGFLLSQSAIAASVRLHPTGPGGNGAGLRMVFFVALPMVIGPAIGAAVIKNADATFVELGQIKQVPTRGSSLLRRSWCCSSSSRSRRCGAAPGSPVPGEWSPRPGTLLTPGGEELIATIHCPNTPAATGARQLPEPERPVAVRLPFHHRRTGRVRRRDRGAVPTGVGAVRRRPGTPPRRGAALPALFHAARRLPR